MRGEGSSQVCVCVLYKIGAMKYCGKRCVHVCATTGMQKKVSGMQYSVKHRIGTAIFEVPF